ncbi:hypothetical protein BB559_001871 [Furculomyces boomerangus]|uniref:Uncharacterized protein n=1 Tax=Furculomyces boomerangus TaxID=61424 RepID=A0A2T9Z029_9FUNG|nr:hypothetical protein BB559_001871 [Furculomyces boomerangus]
MDATKRIRDDPDAALELEDEDIENFINEHLDSDLFEKSTKEISSETTPQTVNNGTSQPSFRRNISTQSSIIVNPVQKDNPILTSVQNSFKDMANASIHEMSLLPGFGDQKARRLKQAFTESFISSKNSK